MSVRALVESDLLTWARRHAGLGCEQVDAAMKQPPGACEAWETGEAITVNQASRFADLCGIGLATLYLPSPPDPIPPLDLREAVEIVLEYALEGIGAEEQMRGGRGGFERSHGTRPYEALEMVKAAVERATLPWT